MGKKHKAKVAAEVHGPGFLENHWDRIVIILLIVIPLVYFASFLDPANMMAGSDYVIGGYPFDKWSLEQEEMPLWYPHVFAGIPVLGSPVGGPLAPLAQLRHIIPPQTVLTLSFIIMFFIAGIGVYAYVKEIGLSRYTAALAAVVYMFTGNLATTPHAGHLGRAASVALFPLMLFFVHRGLRQKNFLYFLCIALVAAFAFYEGHFQITYYALLFVLAYAIYYLISMRKQYATKDYVRVIGFGAIAVILIMLLMAAVWLPVLGGLQTAARGMERGYEYAISWAMPPAELFDLLVPSYSGILGNYWGANAFKQHTEYFGLLTIIFALFAIVNCWKKPYVKFYAIGAFVAGLVALGGATPFFRIVYTIIPGFKLTRAPSLIFYLASFGFVVLGAIGFENTVVKREMGWKKFLTTAAVMFGAFIVLMLIGSGIGKNIAGPKSSAYVANSSQFTQGFLLACGLFLLVLGMIYLALKQKATATYLTIGAIVLALISQVPLMARFLPGGIDPEKYYAGDDIVRFLKEDRSVFRVFPFQTYPPLNPQFLYHIQDSYLLYHDIQSAGGYIANPIQRYQEYIGAGTSVMFTPTNLFLHPRLADMLSLKYIVAPALPDDISRFEPGVQQFIINVKRYLDRLNPVYRGNQFTVYVNDSILPRAYLVPNYRMCEESEILPLLQSEEFDPRTTVIIEQEPGVVQEQSAASMVPAEIVSYSANKIACKVKADNAGFLVLTDNWHPDWKVFVDGAEQEMYRANYIFRAVHVPAGKHEVVFAYISTYFNTGKIISIVTFILTVILLAIAAKPFAALKKK